MKSIGFSFVLAALAFSGCQKHVSSNEAGDDSAVAVAPTPVPTPDYAPPGTFFLLTSVRKETKDGILRLLPGTEVKLLRNGKYQTPEGEMALDATKLTNDRTAARAAQSADSKGQAAARPKAIAATYAAVATPAPQPVSLQGPLTQQAPPAAAAPAAPVAPVLAEDKMRAIKFRLTSLKTEEARLATNLEYLWERLGRRKPSISPGGLSSSTSLGDYDAVSLKLMSVRAEISTLEAKLQEAGK